MFQSGSVDLGHLPKLKFPMFDEENPKLWIRRSHDYFELYAVDQLVCVKVASMHFVGPVARWLSSLDEHQSFQCSWFCRLLLDRFSKDEHEVFIYRLFCISQTTTVKEYVDQFHAEVEGLGHKSSSHTR